MNAECLCDYHFTCPTPEYRKRHGGLSAGVARFHS